MRVHTKGKVLIGDFRFLYFETVRRTTCCSVQPPTSFKRIIIDIKLCLITITDVLLILGVFFFVLAEGRFVFIICHVATDGRNLPIGKFCFAKRTLVK